MIHIDFTLSYLEIYLILINLITFMLYSYDKVQAVKNLDKVQRVSEKKLLFSTLIGGTLGSIISMLIFRHKIKKASFVIKFTIVAIIQVLAIFFYN
ncbi:DUF1294 domain-containing protein [Sulfurimonas sp.]|uniref:DUF1294 domain-containing protein n=1 Tax=Sulfurimonas sp. TaxID=2022749 RepID=UPI003564B5D0